MITKDEAIGALNKARDAYELTWAALEEIRAAHRQALNAMREVEKAYDLAWDVMEKAKFVSPSLER